MFCGVGRDLGLAPVARTTRGEVMLPEPERLSVHAGPCPSCRISRSISTDHIKKESESVGLRQQATAHGETGHGSGWKIRGSLA